jgi:hypothetical protein
MVRQELEDTYARLSHVLAQSAPVGALLLQDLLQEILAPGELRETMLRGVEHTITRDSEDTGTQILQHSLVIQELNMVGDEAHAEVVQTVDSIQRDDDGYYGPKGDEHLLEGVLRYRDVWVQIAERWYLISTNPLQETLRVDGELWPPSSTEPEQRPEEEATFFEL